MIIAAWVAIGILAVANLGAGLVKLVRSKQQLATMGPPFAWTQDFSPAQIRLIAAAEILGAIGLLLPRLTGILPWLTGVAALGIAVLQAGAIVTHLRRGEKAVIPNIVILVLALVVSGLVSQRF